MEKELTLYKADTLIAVIPAYFPITELSKFAIFIEFDYLYIKFAEKQPLKHECKDILIECRKDILELSKQKLKPEYFGECAFASGYLETSLMVDTSKAFHKVYLENKYPGPYLARLNTKHLTVSITVKE